MAIDTSFYNTTPAPPPNPLAMMSQMQGIQHQQMQNQLLRKTMLAQQARGQAYAANTDANGNVSTGGAMASMAQDPNATFGLDDAATSNQALSQAQFTQHAQQIDRVNQILGSTLKLATNPDGTPNPKALEDDSVLKGVGDQMVLSGVPAATVASQLASMPKDGQGRYAALTQHLVAGMQAQSQAQAIYGQLYSQNDGQNIHNFRMPEVAGAAPSSVQMHMTPEAAASPVAGPVGPNGEQTTIPLGQRAGTGTITTSQGPAKTAAQTTTGGLGAQGEAAFSQQRSAASQNEATFNLLQSEIPKAFTGAGAEQRTSWARIAQTLGLPADSNTITASESVAKALAKMINAQPNASNSDKQLASQIAANPHVGLSKDGMTQMVAIAKGNNAQLEAVGNAWDKIKAKGVGAERFNEAQPLLNQRMPATAFQYMALPPGMRHVLTDGMSKTEKADLMHTIEVGQKAGWLK